MVFGPNILKAKGDDPKIAYQEKEIHALMEEKRVLNDLLTKQDHMIETLVKRLREAAA